MTLLPRSVTGQLALVIALVLTGALLLAGLLVRELATRPAVEQLLRAMDGFANVVEAESRTRPRTEVIDELRSAGLQVRETPPPSATRRVSRSAPFLRELSAASRAQLQLGREVRIAQDGDRTLLWLKLSTAPPLWVSFGVEHRRASVRRFSMAMLIGCVLLVWLAATFFARRLALPLRRLAQAAPELVRGESPPLGDALHGPREVQELAQALTRASSDVRTAASDRALMLAGISHDLRTPLTRLQYALALVPDTDATLREGMERDIAEIDAILSQFIAYARDGRDEANEDLDLAGVCRNALAASTSSWDATLPPSAPMRGSPMALLRAVENLIVNAERHGAAPFSCALTQEGDGWRIDVVDHGPGLSFDQSQRLRQAFAREGTASGAGLGLAIVERVARQHGGDLRLTPLVPHGLCASLSLRRTSS